MTGTNHGENQNTIRNENGIVLKGEEIIKGLQRSLRTLSEYQKKITDSSITTTKSEFNNTYNKSTKESPSTIESTQTAATETT